MIVLIIFSIEMNNNNNNHHHALRTEERLRSWKPKTLSLYTEFYTLALLVHTYYIPLSLLDQFFNLVIIPVDVPLTPH
jgi:hypothetical protein